MKYKIEARDFWGDKLPKRVRMLHTVRGDFPFNLGTNARDIVALVGVTYEIQLNKLGAVFLAFSNGAVLGLKPGEFDVVEWQEVEFE